MTSVVCRSTPRWINVLIQEVNAKCGIYLLWAAPKEVNCKCECELSNAGEGEEAVDWLFDPGFSFC